MIQKLCYKVGSNAILIVNIKPHWVVAVLTLCLLWVGCATIINGTSQDIGIASSPSGADAFINPGNVKVITPGNVTLKRKNNYSLSFKKDAYEDGSATISNSVSGWLWGNIIIGGLIGLAIDISSGGGYKLTPENVFITLQNKNLSSSVIQHPSSGGLPAEQKSLDNLKDQLNQIEEMKSDGLISEEEYLKLKKKIINNH